MNNAKQKKSSLEDWHPADIKAALNKKGFTLMGLAKAHGLAESSSMSATFTRSLPLNEERIADAIGVHPMVIWPSRYNTDGTRKLQGFRVIQNSTPTVKPRNSKAIATDSSLVQTA
ncbi:MAG: helix-turn-helix transcriptional regulator [Methylotenera sp.]|nr:helix-turn-helix transcriptional regulator [Methylococcaceae bacterium]MDP3819312.1 helix-turn-helix transcriptional regulator [Methylotenera sp.]